MSHSPARIQAARLASGIAAQVDGLCIELTRAQHEIRDAAAIALLNTLRTAFWRLKTDAAELKDHVATAGRAGDFDDEPPPPPSAQTKHVRDARKLAAHDIDDKDDDEDDVPI